MKKTRRLKKVPAVLLMVMTGFGSFAAGQTIYAKYVISKQLADPAFIAGEFYFSSDHLSADSNPAMENVSSDTPVTIHLYNYQTENAQAVSSEDISYSCTVRYQNEDGSSSGSPTVFSGQLSGKDSHAASFQIASSSSQASVSCTSSKPYAKQLTGRFHFQSSTSLQAAYEVKDSREGYVMLYVYANGTSDTQLTIDYDSSRYALDHTDPLISSLTDHSVLLPIQPFTTYVLTFYKIKDLTAAYSVAKTAVANHAIALK